MHAPNEARPKAPTSATKAPTPPRLGLASARLFLLWSVVMIVLLGLLIKCRASATQALLTVSDIWVTALEKQHTSLHDAPMTYRHLAPGKTTVLLSWLLCGGLLHASLSCSEDTVDSVDASATTASNQSAGNTGGGGGTGGGGMGGSTSGLGGGGGDGGDTGTLAPPANPVGIGLVGPGNSSQWDRTAELAGRGGHIKLVFAGVDMNTNAAPQDWVNAVQGVYARNLVPVIRMGPHWGDRNIRQYADDDSKMSYQALAAKYALAVADLPLRDEWPLVIEVHNEPNLCYEWACQPDEAPSHPDVAAGWIHYSDMAAEYAAFLRDVTTALHALGDSRIQVINGGLAPGGAVACQCAGDGFQPGITSIAYLQAMQAAVPNAFSTLDGFSSHPYPASGEGYGFFDSYDQSAVGLSYYQKELTEVGVPLEVYITETGWTVGAGAMGSREQIAQWTVQAWENDWYDKPQIRAVMPFMLQDGNWNDFAWLDSSGQPYPVFNAVRDWRCGKQLPEACN